MARLNGISTNSNLPAGGPDVEPEPISGSVSLARATAVQGARTDIPSQVVEADGARSPRVRAREADERVAAAVERAEGLLSGWVTEGEASQALEALAWLRPEELGRALYSLEAGGRLDDLVRNLSPERLLDLTRMLASSGIFRWEGAVDENAQPIPGAPRLVEVHEKLPPALQSLAHDINLAIAKQHPTLKLYEPGVQGGMLDAKQHPLLAWRDGPFGPQVRHVEAFVHRYLAVVDIDSSVHQLRPGDSYRLSADAGVMVGLGVKGLEASAGGALASGVEVSRAEDGKSFTVQADPSLLAKLSAAAGLSATGLPMPTEKVMAEVGAGGGGKVEFAFKTADEAARAAQLLMEAMTNPARFAADAVLHLADVRKVLAAVSAIELGSQAAAKLGLEGDEGLGVLGAAKKSSTQWEGGLSTTYRIEFSAGKPVALSMKNSMAFESSVGESQAFKFGEFSMEFSKGVSASVCIDLERRVTIPPEASLKEVGRAAWHAPATMTVGLGSKKSGAFGESGAELQFKLEGHLDTMLAAAIALQQGDVESAAVVFDKAEVTSTRTAASGVALTVGLGAGGTEGKFGMKAMRKRQLAKHTEEGSGREMALRLLKSLGGQVGPDAPRPVEMRTVRPG